MACADARAAGQAFVITGAEPQLVVRPSHVLERGWYEVILSADLGQQSAARLCFDLGSGFQQAALLLRHAERHYSAIVRLHKPIELVRLEPFDRPGAFSVEALALRPLSLAELTLRRAAHLCRRMVRSRPAAGRIAVNRGTVLARKGFVSLTGDLPASDYERHADWLARYDYAAWIARHDYDRIRDRAALLQKIERLAVQPRISVLMPVYDTKADELEAAIRSVVRQVYPGWELCIADDASTRPHVREILDTWRQRDPRITVAYRTDNGHISRATNTAMELATGDWAALLDHDDILSENALAEVAIAISENPAADFFYSDEDKLDVRGDRHGRHAKPDWNEELFRSQNYVNHLAVYRMELLRRIGGLRDGLEGSQDHDLGFRIAAATTPDRIVHIPKVLYHWRAFEGSGSFSDGAMHRAKEARQRAARDHLAAKGIDAQVVEGRFGLNRVIYAMPEPAPKVTVVTAAWADMRCLRACVAGLLDRTSYQAADILIVVGDADQRGESDQLTDLATDARVSLFASPAAATRGALMNDAVAAANGDVICFMDGSIGVIDTDWLTEMVSRAVQPGVGAVGALLLYPDGRVRHAGIDCSPSGISEGFCRFLPMSQAGYAGRLHSARDVSAVSSACLVVEKSKLLHVGGIDPDYQHVTYGDVDFCLKLEKAGFRTVLTPFARFYLREHASRLVRDTGQVSSIESDRKQLMRKWADRLRQGPIHNRWW